MKKLLMPILMGAVLITSGCAQRVVDFTMGSTKNVNLNSGQFIEGDRVEADDTKVVVLVPLGVPSLKEATDRAIEKDKCAVGLTNVTADSEVFSFLIGYISYNVEGNLLIDKSQPGCESWKG